MEKFEFAHQKEYDLIALGRVTVDLNPVDYNKPLSESVTFNKYIGGSPANIATGLARLGKKVGFISRVSNDQMGDFVLSFFKKEGIDTSRILRCTGGEKQGLCFTEILDETSSSMLLYRHNASDLALCIDDVDEQYIKQCKALLISGMALSASTSREAAIKAMFFALKHGVKIIFDIDYRDGNWKCDGDISIYCSLIARESDIIIGSRKEYNLLQHLISPGMEDGETAKYWLKQKAQIIIIKHGKDGSTAYTRDGSAYVVSSFPVKPLKSIGGGDGYASAFLYGLFEGYSIPECLKLGSASAAILVANHACSAYMPTQEQLYDFIDKSKLEHGEVVFDS